jgi:hypothetical protein
MDSYTQAVLVSILLLLLLAAWVPFLDTCAGLFERREKRRAAPVPGCLCPAPETSSTPATRSGAQQP